MCGTLCWIYQNTEQHQIKVESTLSPLTEIGFESRYINVTVWIIFRNTSLKKYHYVSDAMTELFIGVQILKCGRR